MSAGLAHAFAIGFACLVVNPGFDLCSSEGRIERAGQRIERPINTDPPPTRYPAAQWRMLWNEAPPMPVFDTAAVWTESGVVLFGGVNDRFETTPAIQMKQHGRPWRPIGSQMLEARAGHTVTILEDGRALIVGGWQGSLNGEKTALASCEVLHPWIAGSTAVESADEPLIGHSAHSLSEGLVAVVGRNSIRVFDGRDLEWIARIPLATARAKPSAVVLNKSRLVIVGGDERGTIESVILTRESLLRPGAELKSHLWQSELGVAVSECGVAPLPNERILVVGGVDRETGESVGRTWVVDALNEGITPGPYLAVAGGVAAPAVMPVGGDRAVVLGGERRGPSMREPADVARVLDIELRRAWTIADVPNRGSRRVWLREPGGRIIAIGGYRFVTPVEAKATGLRQGVHILSEAYALDVRMPDLVNVD